MKSRIKYVFLFCLIILIGGGLRLTGLERRPMHNDEAVNSVKFGTLLESGNYTYDKKEYHGPVLYYLTLIPAYLSKTSRFSELHEWQLRIIPAIAGIGLLVLLLFLKNVIGWEHILAVTFIGAISPAMVFYSRYFIHEMLLVLFTYGFIVSIFLFFKLRYYRWLIMAGIFAGMMYTTKETFILAIAAFLLALIEDQAVWNHRPLHYIQTLRSLRWHHYLIFIIIVCSISIVLFTSFFRNPRGIVDSLTAMESYFFKAAESKMHWHPWYYYLQILSWNKGPGYVIWTELPVLILAFLGMCHVFVKKEVDEKDQFFRVIALFSLILLLVYSFIPYKTPWNMLSFYFGFILMAGYEVIQLTHRFENKRYRIVLWILMIGVALHLISQVLISNFRYPAHPSNPYVYGHTGMDVFTIVNRIRQVTVFHPEGKEIYIQVICTDHDYWPLPWYLRDFKNVGWWDHVDVKIPLAPVIIASPDLESALIEKMYKIPAPGEKYLYVPLFKEKMELRPGIEIMGFIRQDYQRF